LDWLRRSLIPGLSTPRGPSSALDRFGAWPGRRL